MWEVNRNSKLTVASSNARQRIIAHLQERYSYSLRRSQEVLVYFIYSLFNIFRMDRYERVEKSTATLGEGTYGVVYKARDKQSNKFVALKVTKHHQILPA